MQSLCILGRQPSLGIAELESLFGASFVEPVGTVAALVDRNPAEIPFARIGGSSKLASVLTRLETNDWAELIAYITHQLPKRLDHLPEGKLKFGLSVYGFPVNVPKINAAALSIKKAVKATSRSIRVVPNNEPTLNSAQVLHNQLTGDLGMELLLVKDGTSTILAQTVREQDIDAYAARDHGRPMRDARVGMLPPKLAQVIVNLARPADDGTVLDPFCGTGVILQEASLMGYGIYGSDLEPRMIEYTDKNLQWLETQTQKHTQGATEVADATNHAWQQTPFTTIACETYLGRPFSIQPKPEVLQEVMQDVDTIHKKFLRNVTSQTQAGFRMCIAVPAWKTHQGFKHLKTLDSLEELGYTRLKFVHARDEDLIYHREGQIVARELVVLIRK